MTEIASAVLIVPLGMALAGMSMGNGRSAYATPFGQLAVGAGIGMAAGRTVGVRVGKARFAVDAAPTDGGAMVRFTKQ